MWVKETVKREGEWPCLDPLLQDEMRNEGSWRTIFSGAFIKGSFFPPTLLIFKAQTLLKWWNQRLYLLIQPLHGVSRHYTNYKTLGLSWVSLDSRVVLGQ